MSIAIERQIVDFTEHGLSCAAAGPGVLSRAVHELILRLHDEGLLDELLIHSWIKPPVDLDRGSSPVPRHDKGGCAFALPVAIARAVRRLLP